MLTIEWNNGYELQITIWDWFMNLVMSNFSETYLVSLYRNTTFHCFPETTILFLELV